MQNINSEIASLRRNYALKSLDEQDILVDPILQFDQWFQEARSASLLEPNAMTLATADSEGRPRARTVLLKGFDAAGFVFFTNYNSKKGQDLHQNPQACLLFSWLELERQVRIFGPVHKIAPEESTAYFQSRPKSSQIGAWASPQSQAIDDRTILEQNVERLAAAYADQDCLPRPEYWGGYCVSPIEIEFWQGRENRLHDRIQYTREGNGWNIVRIAP